MKVTKFNIQSDKQAQPGRWENECQALNNVNLLPKYRFTNIGLDLMKCKSAKLTLKIFADRNNLNLKKTNERKSLKVVKAETLLENI